jgi:carbamoyl-phosphate synthase large subunit
MQHIEEAGVHSGDSACVLPPIDLSPLAIDTIEAHTEALARALSVRGLINIQFAVERAGGEVYVLEANPRASRTVPFVSKATGVPLAQAAARIMLGASLAQLRKEGLVRPPSTGHLAVKEAVLPFNRFPDSDALLGPEMRSTGEVMGIAASFGLAFAKSQEAAGTRLPRHGAVFLSVADHDKAGALAVARRFLQMGFELYATVGTAAYLEARGLAARVASKLGEPVDGRPDAVDLIKAGQVHLVLNTPEGEAPRTDGAYIRAAAIEAGIPIITTLAGGWAAAVGIAAELRGSQTPLSLQEWQAGLSQPSLS